MSPKFSVLIGVYQPNPEHLRACIESVIAQSFSDWEIVAVADGPQPGEVEAVLDSFDDARVTLFRRDGSGGIAAASQDALERANGEFVALVDCGAVLPGRALRRVAAALDADAQIDMLYTDEDRLDSNGNRVEPSLKPGFSPERVRTQMYLGQLGIYRRALVNDVGGFRRGFDGSEYHDLALRVSEHARKIGHVPDVLYHQRQIDTSTALDAESEDSAHEARRRVVASHLERTSFPASAVRNWQAPGVIDLEPKLVAEPLVSVIMPTGGACRVARGREVQLVENALRSLTEVTSYQNYEVVVVLDSSAGPGLDLALSQIDSRIRCVPDPRPLSFSGARNLGAVSSTGEVLLFLNDDAQIIQPTWMERMVMYSQRDQIGSVGAKLLFADERIRHAGMWARHGQVAHRYRGFSRNNPGYMSSLLAAQNCLAVTGACLAVRREPFDLVGGFSSTLPFNFGDVDLCLKLLSRGFRSVVDCGVEVLTLESADQGSTVQQWELDEIQTRWGEYLSDGLWDNPNHTAGLVDEMPPTSESLLQNWEAIGRYATAARVLANPSVLPSGAAQAN